MTSPIQFEIGAQPDDETCGPTCLHATYRYFGHQCSLKEVIESVTPVKTGGTIPAYLGCDALKRGFRVTVYSFELPLFDPTWRDLTQAELAEKLRAQALVKKSKRLRQATDAYLGFIELGGVVRFRDLGSRLLREYLERRVPILTGLSSTYLYGTSREFAGKSDDIKGTPEGHFVVLCGFAQETRKVLVADPYLPNPVTEGQYYEVSIEHLISSVFLGALTYDSALLVIEPPADEEETQ